jgi:iron complex transport system substrate-binding protein
MAEPLSIIDDVGRTVSLNEEARKIVLTDGMGLIGLAVIDDDPVSRLAAWNRDRLDVDALRAFQKAKPQIDAVPNIAEPGSGPAMVEQLIALEPDLVVLDPYYNRSKVAIRQMEAAGIAVAVLALTPSVRDKVPAYGIKRLAVLIGRKEQGQAFSDFVGERLERIRTRVSSLAADRRPLVLLEAHAGPKACCVVAGRGQGIGDFVSFVGGHNLGADIVPGMAGQISPEYILTNGPLVYIGTGGAYMERAGGLTVAPSFSEARARTALQTVVRRTGLDSSPAVKTGRTYGLWHGLAISGINIIAIEAMAKWIHPELFADIDPSATLAEINRHFLAVPLEGTMWVGSN